MLLVLISLFLMVPSGMASPGVPATEQKVLRNVVVLAIDPAREVAIRQAVPFRIGEPLTPQGFDALKKNLQATGIPLREIKIGLRPFNPYNENESSPSAIHGTSTDNVELVFDCRPPMQIGDVGVFPLIPVDAEKLKAALPMHAGDAFDPQALTDAVKILQDESGKEGFADTTVTIDTVPLTTTTLSVGFIVEGPSPITLLKRQFKGSGWLNGARIREQLKHMEPVALDKGSTVTALLLQQSEYVATAVMRSLGYLQAIARLGKTEAVPKGLKVTYKVDRGPRYRIASSQTTGLRFPDPAYWEETGAMFIGKPVTAERLDNLKEVIEKQARDAGYMAPEVKVDISPDPSDHTVKLKTHVDEGTTSTLGSIRIERQAPERGYGASWYHRRVAPPLAEEIIRKQIRAHHSDTLNGQITEDATRRLWRLNTFDDVKVDTTATSDTFVRDIVARVKDKRTAFAGLSLGWNDEIGPVSRLSLTEKNVGGRADVLNLSLALGLDEKSDRW